eukprot:m.9061 g.9061  ORF g.9061 m.9061 type:complete len:83 (-) comp4133_c0_seq1:153-401(-)
MHRLNGSTLAAKRVRPPIWSKNKSQSRAARASAAAECPAQGVLLPVAPSPRCPTELWAQQSSGRQVVQELGVSKQTSVVDGG